MVKSEFRKKLIDKILEIRNVTKVGKGRKLMRFRVGVIIGFDMGVIGFGIGKDVNFFTAKLKGIHNAKKNLIKVIVTTNETIPYCIIGKFRTARVILKPAILGTGLRAGLTISTILEVAGIKNIVAKQLGSSNILNNALATFNALKS